MLSNKLTFSLASLVILMMVGLCLPVASQQISKTTIVVLPATGVADADDSSISDVINKNSFAVYGAVADVGISPTPANIDATTAFGMFDLEEFFRLGGTLKLIAPTSIGLKKYDLVISEIMWALDVDSQAAGTTADDRRQWIEVYNTMDDATAALPSGTLKLVFKPFMHVKAAGDTIPKTEGISATAAPVEGTDGVDHIVLDSLSNLQYVRWDLPGQSGNTTIPRTGFALDPPLKPLVSAYRAIDYTKVKGIHKLKADNTVDETANRVEQLKGVPDGDDPTKWKPTPALGSRMTGSGTVPRELIIGTPGAEHVPDLVFTGITSTTKTSIASNSVVITEVRNDTSPANYDWVELHNAGTEAVGLWDWELTLIDGSKAANKTDTVLVGWDKPDTDREKTSFPKNEDFKLQPGAYLLIVNRHPSRTPLADGIDVDGVIAGTNVNAGATHQYIVREKLNLPDQNISLILRNKIDKNARHEHPRKEEVAAARASTDTKSSENIMDYVGTVSLEVNTNEYNTLVWPFKGWTKTAGTDGKDGEAIAKGLDNAHSRKRIQANDGHHKDAWEPVKAKGGLGYDPGVDLRYAPGTPGYANDSIRTQLVDDKNNTDATDDVIYNGEVSISEVMYDAGPRWNLIQWIELYNSSMDEVVNLKGWELEIRNATDEVESYVDSSFVFNDAMILPNQTLLIVSGTGTNDVADNRVYNLYQHHRRELGLTNRRSVLLSPGGFYLKLTDKDDNDRDGEGELVDEAGNVQVKGAQRNVMWELPARDPNMRQSLVRQYGTRELYDGTPDMADDGMMMESWRQSDLTGAGIAFYGHRDDISTPGYRLGGPLPVSLSKFRPVRNQETGHVDIQWITESELNNAGFNILRSEAKNGEFKVINVKGIIAGNGTTSEKHVYTFTDTTAKPNVVYYYQIEDVSINGLRTTLTTTHLRGHVGAAGKLTTRWGELKSSK